jgi:hypothetical protein
MGVRGTFIVAVALLLASGSAACHNPNAYVLSPDSVDQFLAFAASAPSLPADGVSRITLTASIDPNATSSNRTIKFSTSAGTLIAAGQKSTTDLDVVVDGSGKALVELQSTNVVLTCRVSARIKDLVRTVNVLFTAPNADDVLILAVAPPTLPADGFSRARITATVKLLSDPSQRIVTFKTSTGTLFSSQQPTNSGKSVDVPTDSSGVAFVDLQSSSSVETAFVSATAAGVTRNVTVGFTPPAAGSIVTLAASAGSAPADGATLVQVTATIAAAIPTGSRTVEFTATDGTFVNGGDGKTAKVTPDASNRAVIDLKAPSLPTSVRVTVTVNNVSASVTITFGVALPDSIFVSPVSAQIRNTDTDLIRVSLLRNIGVASANQVVVYRATDAMGKDVGVFSDVRLTTISSTTGAPVAVSSAIYSPPATALPGPITIQASVGGVAGTAVIQIVP